jgi:hypothetical protein
MEAIEVTRARFRPKRIITLFVGESAPASGDFFYSSGNTAMLKHMKSAVEDALGQGGNFLERFKAYGWYLHDLVLTPVKLTKPSERKAKCLEAQNGLANRIAEYQPHAIVSLLLSIQKIVGAAPNKADSEATRFAVPFPGMGHQWRFRAEMARSFQG